MSNWLLRLSLRAYPRAIREQDGKAILDLATELSAQGPAALSRESCGLLAGGLKAQLRFFGLYMRHLPWRAAREWVAFPVSVALFCMISVVITCRVVHIDYPFDRITGSSAWLVAPDLKYGFHFHWLWAVLIAASGASVVGTGLGKRWMSVAGTLVVSFVLVRNMLMGGNSSLMFDVPIGGIQSTQLAAVWGPVALLLLGCVGATGSSGKRRPDHALWIAVALAVASFASALYAPRALGILFIYLPIAVVLGTACVSLFLKDPAARTGTALLVLFSWPAAFFSIIVIVMLTIPLPGMSEGTSAVIYLVLSFLLACAMIAALLPRRILTPRQAIGANRSGLGAADAAGRE
jgi:hypothetical protein